MTNITGAGSLIIATVRDAVDAPCGGCGSTHVALRSVAVDLELQPPLIGGKGSASPMASRNHLATTLDRYPLQPAHTHISHTRS